MKKLTSLALASVSLVALATPAFAQDAAGPEDEANAPPPIIVEARRKDESIQDVPLNVQAVTAEDLQKLDIKKFEDVTKTVPGLQLAGNTNGLGTTASLRGVNFDANASGSSTTVEFYRNDAVITSGALFQAVYDIGQVEVLRGPQGTLRGRASPSGSITVTTKRPDLLGVGGYASGTYGELGRWNFNAAVNVPIVEGKLGVRVAGFVGESKGNNINGLNVVTGAIDDDIWDKTRALRASVRADPFDGVLMLDFNFETISRKNRGYDQVVSFNLVNSTAAASPRTITIGDELGIAAVPRGLDVRYKIYNWQAKLNLWGQSLTYVGAALRGKLMAFDPEDNAGIFGTGGAASDPNKLFSQTSDNVTNQDVNEIRLQNQERILGLFDYVIGGMRVKAHTPTLFNRNTGVGTGPFPYTLTSVIYSGTYRFRDDTEESLFGNLTVHPFDGLEISGGIRKIWYKANSGVATGTYGNPVSSYTVSASTVRCFGDSSVVGCLPAKKATIYSAVVKYNINDDIMVYGSYGTSWRPGNSVIGWRGATAGTFLNQFLNLPDETSKSWEAGFKTSWLNNRLRFNVSAYSQQFTNYAYRLASPVLSLSNTTSTASIVAAFNFVAPVNAKVKGFEAELAYDVSDNLSFGATVSFADGKIKGGIFPCVDLDNNNVPDTAAPTAAQLYAETNGNQVDTCVGDTSPSSQARWAGTFRADYTMPVGETTDVYLRTNVGWKGNSEGFSLNPYDQVKSYALVDLFAGITGNDGGWDLGFYAKNVFNTHRVLTMTDSPLSTTLSTGAVNSTNYMGITTTDPREFGVTFRVAFGSK